MTDGIPTLEFVVQAALSYQAAQMYHEQHPDEGSAIWHADMLQHQFEKAIDAYAKRKED